MAYRRWHKLLRAQVLIFRGLPNAFIFELGLTWGHTSVNHDHLAKCSMGVLSQIMCGTISSL